MDRQAMEGLVAAGTVAAVMIPAFVVMFYFSVQTISGSLQNIASNIQLHLSDLGYIKSNLSDVSRIRDEVRAVKSAVEDTNRELKRIAAALEGIQKQLPEKPPAPRTGPGL